MNKFAANVERDQTNEERLCRLGWSVLRIWECEVRCEEKVDELFWKIVGRP